MLRRIRRRRGESGFTLLEVVVAMFVFAILAASSLALVTRTAQVANNNIRRTTAANLATSQIEAVRSQSVLAIPDGLVTTYAPVNPGSTGNFFTIRQTSSFVPGGTATTVCADTGNALAYKRITVQVTWPGMGSTQPVRADTLRAVGIGNEGLDQTKGSLAVTVVNSAGTPAVGVNVTVSLGSTSLSQVTGADGCLIFTGLAPGTYTATANTPGFVGTQNTQLVSKSSMGVTANTVSRGSLLVDTARSAVIAFDTAVPDPVAPANLPLTYRSTYVTTPVATPSCAGSPTVGCADAVPGTIRNFFPEQYTLRVGTCDAPETSTAPGGDLKPATSEGSTILVPMGVITVDVQNAVGQSLMDRPVTFTHAAQPLSGCTGGETYTVKTSRPGGTPVALPYGTWTVTTPKESPPVLGQVLGLTAPISLTPAQRSGSGVLKVTS